MLRDITIGQFYPVDSVIHRLDPRVKLFGTFFYIIALFIANNIITWVFMTVVLIALVASCKVPFSFMIRGLRSIVLLFVLAGVLNLLFTPGEAIFSFGIINISYVGIKNTLLMIYRIMYLIIGTSVMTLCTTPSMLTAGMERAFGFLKVFKAPVHDIAMMMSIALRFIPILMEEADKIIKAQQARGADFESGGLIKKAKSLVPILVPLFVSSFRRANELALAMEARCYNGGEGRTKMNPLTYSKRDIIGYTVIITLFIVLIIIRVTVRVSLISPVL